LQLTFERTVVSEPTSDSKVKVKEAAEDVDLLQDAVSLLAVYLEKSIQSNSENCLESTVT
tara:strand:- start:575 stop:754 length:180 start_codon:yes stop_codon:yes gene_type:complete